MALVVFNRPEAAPLTNSWQASLSEVSLSVKVHGLCERRFFSRGQMFRKFCRLLIQEAIILVARPYIYRELPAWGLVYRVLVGDYRRNWLWADARKRLCRDKLTGFTVRLEPSSWTDRSAVFLGRWYDLEMQLFLADVLKPGDTVVDVGANKGNFALSARKYVGVTGKVICFEPNPECFAILCEKIQENLLENIIAHNVGLSDQRDEMTLTVPVVNNGEGTLGRSHYSGDKTSRFCVQVEVGDEALRKETPALIKLDVEGFEFRVLRGLQAVMQKEHPLLITEVIQEHLMACGSSREEIESLMKSGGYESYKLGLAKGSRGYTWQLERTKPSDDRYDAVWVHKQASPLVYNTIRARLSDAR